MSKRKLEKLLVKDLDYVIDKSKILDEINLSIEENEIVGLIGPNGCGKSTLLKNIYRVYKPDKGTSYIDGKNITNMSGKDVAKAMAVVTQENKINFDFTVKEMMLMGRYAYKSNFGSYSKDDFYICEEALEEVGMLEFKDRSFLSLSGGEKQRVLIASAFSRKTSIIIMDEPTNHLDIGYQFSIMEMMKKRENTTIFASIHDMNIAAQFCDRIIAMDKGSIVACGKPEEILTPELMRDLFRVKVRVEKNRDLDEESAIRLVYTGSV